MSNAKKVVLVSKRGYDASHDGLLRSLIARKIELFCAVGRQCELWEEVMDALVVGPTGECEWHVTTSSHPSETVDEVVEFAKNWRLDEPSEVEVIEV
jgi:hypothetical protein